MAVDPLRCPVHPTVCSARHLSSRETKSLDPSGSEPLRALVVQLLERLEVEGPAALEAACRENPSLADGLRRRMATLAELGLVDAGSSHTVPERIGDFQLLEKIGAGGMGVVYRAVQSSLGREVALKLIRPNTLNQDEARERFTRETAIVAKLSHPGIVPIHVVGSEDEMPYYAMEYVPGCTLAEALSQLSGRTPAELTGADLWRAVRARTRSADAPPTEPEGMQDEERPSSLFAGSWEEACLRVLGQVSEALEHAHERGVLHRDLKPSNVMITPQGRVMLMDFGLSQTEGAETVTRSGDRIGSLPYMPPELLRDGSATLSMRSDVYGLGVTLYELLTMRLPFSGEGVPTVIAAIIDGRPPRPRAHHPGLSWEAETVCLAALDRDPQRRYSDAAGLTRDLSNALHHKPVEARRASLALRARRWVERHPGEAAAAVLLMLLPLVAALLLARETRHVSAALTVAQEDRGRALRSIEVMLVRLGDERLDGMPGMLALRREFLGEATGLYEEILQDRPDDRKVALLAARCEHLRNRMLREEARYSEAEEAARRALDHIRPLVAQNATNESAESRASIRKLYARLLDDAMVSLGQQERHAEAQAHASESIEVLRSVLRENPDDAEARRLLLLMLSDFEFRRRLYGDTAGGLDVLGKSVDGLRELLALHPDDETRRALADSLKALAHGLSTKGRHEEASEFLEELVQVWQQLLAADPRDEDARFKVAQSASFLAGELVDQHREEEALVSLDVAADEIGRVRLENPNVPAYDYLGAHVATNMSAALANLRRFDESCAASEFAVEILLELHDRHPANAEYTRTLGSTLIGLASSQASLGEPAAALETCDMARDLIEQALESRPQSEDWRKWLAIGEYTRAKALLALGRPGDAASCLVETITGAGPRTDVASAGLQRLLQCIEQARDGQEGEQRDMCELAARQVLRLAGDRDDLADDPKLQTLRELVVGD